MHFHDRVSVSGKRKLADGRLVADARFARAGIYVYAGREVDPDNAEGLRDQAEVRVYRPPEEVFDENSMRSFAFKAVTDDHPPEMVTAANWKTFAKGFTDGQVVREGDFVRVPMMLADADIVAGVEDGKKELSAGYDAELIFGIGTTPAGEHYDALMRTIRGNHIAVVDKGRAGAECRIADAATEGVNTMAEPRTMVFDGITITVTDQSEQAIGKLQRLLADAGTAIETANSAHAAAIADKDRLLGERDAKIVDLESKVLTDEQLDARVAERAGLIADVAKVADGIETKGKSVGDIRRAAVAKALGDKADLTGKSDDYVCALFDSLVARASANPNGGGTGGSIDGLAAALGDTLPGGSNTGGGTDGATAFQKLQDRRANAWKDPEDQAAAA